MKDEQVSGKTQKKEGSCFLHGGALEESVSFAVQSRNRCAVPSWRPLSSVFEEGTIQMNIHLETKMMVYGKRKDIVLANSISNHFQIYNTILLSEEWSPRGTNSGVSTMWCTVTMETTVLFNWRLNNCFLMLKVATASNVTAQKSYSLVFSNRFLFFNRLVEYISALSFKQMFFQMDYLEWVNDLTI